VELDQVPILKGWMTGAQVARELRISRATVNRMFAAGEFKTLHQLGDRPVLVVREGEVRRVQRQMKAA
jgi:hypothetical protein